MSQEDSTMRTLNINQAGSWAVRGLLPALVYSIALFLGAPKTHCPGCGHSNIIALGGGASVAAAGRADRRGIR